MSGKRESRSARGQALAEGAVALVLISMLAIVSVLLLVGTALAVYYKLKLACVAESAAVSAVEGRYWLGAQKPYPLYDPVQVESRTVDLAKSMAEKLGLGSAPKVTVDQSSIKLASVSVTAEGLPLLSGGMLPSSLAMSDTAVRPYIQRHPIGVGGLTLDIVNLNSVGKGIYFPVYGATPGTAGPSSCPTANFPYWQGKLGPLLAPQSMYGPYQSWDGGGAFTQYSW